MSRDPATRVTTGARPAAVWRGAAAAACWMAAAAWASGPAAGQVTAPAHKISSELRLAIEARQAPQQPWVREAGGQRVLRVLVTGKGRGADLAAVRDEILRRGGQVLSHQPETSTAVAVLPATLVNTIASRADVLHVAVDKTSTDGAVVTVNGVTVTTTAGFAPGTGNLRARNDLALLGE